MSHWTLSPNDLPTLCQDSAIGRQSAFSNNGINSHGMRKIKSASSQCKHASNCHS